MDIQGLLNDFRKEQPELFDENGKAFMRLSHVEPMTRMLKLINVLSFENERLKKEVTLMREAEKTMANMLGEMQKENEGLKSNLYNKEE